MAGDQFTPNANDQLFDPTSGTLTEIGRRLIRNLAAAVGALAPLNARYWLSTSDPTLTNEQNLGALATGYLKLTTAIGIATPSTVATIPDAATLTTARTINGVSFNGAANISLDKEVALVDGATPALDASAGTVFRLAAGGNRTIAVPSNPRPGQLITIAHLASGGVNRTLALNAGAGGFRFGTTITALSATTSGLTDYIDARYNSTANLWDVVNYVKGF